MTTVISSCHQCSISKWIHSDKAPFIMKMIFGCMRPRTCTKKKGKKILKIIKSKNYKQILIKYLCNFLFNNLKLIIGKEKNKSI